MCKILLSINPRYVEKILSGEKNMNLELESQKKSRLHLDI